MGRDWTRRRLLAAATVGIAGVAGCSGLDDGSGSADGDGTTSTAGTGGTATSGADGTAMPSADGTATPGEDATATPGEAETTSTAQGYELVSPPAFDDPDDVGDGVAAYRNVQFARPPEGPLALDLYRPDDDVARPLLVHVHGGGWAFGNRRWEEEGRRHAELGIAAATISYRLSGTATYPAAVRDVVAGVTWLRREAADVAGIDPDRVVLIGESAGAHLSALVGNAADVANFRPPGVEPAVGDVDGVVGISGIYHLTTEGTDDEPLTNRFFGCTGSECPAKYREGSPATHVDGDAPATLLYHGTADAVVPYRASTMYRDDLQAAGVPVELITGEGGEHVTPYQDPWGERMRTGQNEFLAERLDLNLAAAAVRHTPR